MTTELPIDAITVEDRHRRDLGDINALAESIDTLGLIHPIVVTPEHRLVAGERRLAAACELGWDVIPVTVIHSLGDYASVLEAERDENTCRKDFTPSEAVAVADAIAALLKPKAAERKAEGNARGGQVGGKLPPTPKTRDMAAKGTGYSGRTLDKAREVIELAENPQTPEPVRETAKEALAEMDRTGNVSKAHRKAKESPTPPGQPARPRRRPLVDTAREIGLDLKSLTGRMEKLLADDRFARNISEVAPHLRHYLTEVIKVCQDLNQQLT